jgi:hypothetical protein
MEIKAQITKKLQKYKADEIKTLYQLMLRVLSGNDDFRMVQNADTDDLRPVIEGETGEKIDFAMESIISGESLKLWQDIQAEEAEKVKLKKADRIERIASVMSDAALFEGFCLAFYGKDEMLAVLCSSSAFPAHSLSALLPVSSILFLHYLIQMQLLVSDAK